MTRSGARGPYARTAETRRMIVDACVAAFTEVGYYGASMADIARRAGISHTGLVHHFPTIEQLLVAVLTEHDERTAEFLAARTPTDVVSAEDTVRGIVWALVQQPMLAGLTEVNAMLSAEAVLASHPAHDFLASRYSAVERFLTREFAGLRARGDLSSAHSDFALAALTIALVEGLQKLGRYDSGVRVEPLVSSFLSEMLVPGGRAHPGEEAAGPSLTIGCIADASRVAGSTRGPTGEPSE